MQSASEKSLGKIDLDGLVDREGMIQMEGSVQLTLVSGVASQNDNIVGVFNDSTTACICARLLMELDRNSHPEYTHYKIEKTGNAADG